MANSIFKKGYEVNRENVRKQEVARENMGKRLFDFFLTKDGEEADVRFLTEEPINYDCHIIPVGNRYESYTCTGSDCPFCADGDKPKARGAFLLIDRREYSYKNKEGKEITGKNQLRFYSQGTRVVSQLDRLSEKYGITNRDLTIVRLGSGTSTTYTFERGDEDKLTSTEIESLIPERLRDKYDGTMESLYRMVEEQLMMRTKDYVAEEEDDSSASSDGLVNIDDDELPFGNDEPKSGLKKKSLFKHPQNSLKPRAKNLV